MVFYDAFGDHCLACCHLVIQEVHTCTASDRQTIPHSPVEECMASAFGAAARAFRWGGVKRIETMGEQGRELNDKVMCMDGCVGC